MLGYFPTPYPDELLYSVIARYQIHCGIHSAKELVRDLFLNHNTAAVVDFPGHLAVFTNQVSRFVQFSTNDWIQHHTLYPAYLALVPKDRQRQILQSAYSDKASDIHTRLGVCASSIKSPAYLRLCEQCIKEQHEKYGEAYWQRTLQLPGVVVCPHHKEHLYSSDIPYHPTSKFSFIPAEKSQLVRTFDLIQIEKHKNQLVQLAQGYFDLLHTPLSYEMSYSKISQFHTFLAAKHGMLRKSRVKHDVVVERLMKKWPIDCLKMLDPLLVPIEDWAKLLFRKPRKVMHPLYHLLIWQGFDEYDVKSVLDVISQFPERHRKEICISENANPTTKCIKERQKWTNYLKSNPNKSVTWLRISGGAAATYTWLYRHDREWLQNNIPKEKRAATFYKRINWIDRDAYILQVLIKFESEMQKNPPKFRMSAAWWIKNIEQRSTLEKHRDKLPKCKKFIDSHSESVEQFQRRRILTIIRDNHLNKLFLPTWKIIRQAGIRKEFITDELIRFIWEAEEKSINGLQAPNLSQHTH